MTSSNQNAIKHKIGLLNLAEELGNISQSGVRSIWLRNNLASLKDRLKALERKSAEDGLVLTKAQVQALERKKQDDLACGEIEIAHPGYLGSQDTFYVGTMKWYPLSRQKSTIFKLC